MRGGNAQFIRGGCVPSVMLDGVVLRVGGTPGQGSLLLVALLKVTEIQALEVYPGAAGMPVQAAGYISPCGAIVAWSRR